MTLSKRPIVQIEKDSTDRIIESFGWISFIALIVLPSYYWGQLPDEIPSHFNAKGEVDSHDDKSMLWIITGLGTLLFLSFKILNKYPHTFNYLTKITLENAKSQYTRSTKLLRSLNTLTTAFLAYLTYAIIQIGLGNIKSLGIWYGIGFLIIILGTIIYYMTKNFKEK